jgi:hypothetical protein
LKGGGKADISQNFTNNICDSSLHRLDKSNRHRGLFGRGVSHGQGSVFKIQNTALEGEKAEPQNERKKSRKDARLAPKKATKKGYRQKAKGRIQKGQEKKEHFRDYIRRKADNGHRACGA